MLSKQKRPRTQRLSQTLLRWSPPYWHCVVTAQKFVFPSQAEHFCTCSEDPELLYWVLWLGRKTLYIRIVLLPGTAAVLCIRSMYILYDIYIYFICKAYLELAEVGRDQSWECLGGKGLPTDKRSPLAMQSPAEFWAHWTHTHFFVYGRGLLPIICLKDPNLLKGMWSMSPLAASWSEMCRSHQSCQPSAWDCLSWSWACLSTAWTFFVLGIV